MKWRLVQSGLVLAMVTVSASAGDASLEAGRELSDRFMAELGAALQTALAEGGANAIGVCNLQAPAIAAELSASSPAIVSRTSNKPRNPANSPDPWESRVLKEFAERAAAGEPTAGIEVLETTEAGDARYMRAIGMQPMCLQCHGENISPEVADRLAKLYPNDQATGYRAGELRGAFSIRWNGEG